MPKKDLHPEYFPQAKVTCTSCGATYVMGSTVPEMTIEVCANCHPFFTGKEVLMDTEGRVEKFEKKRSTAAKHEEARAKKAPKPEEEQKRPLTLKELLEKN